MNPKNVRKLEKEWKLAKRIKEDEYLEYDRTEEVLNIVNDSGIVNYCRVFSDDRILDLMDDYSGEDLLTAFNEIAGTNISPAEVIMKLKTGVDYSGGYIIERE